MTSDTKSWLVGLGLCLFFIALIARFVYLDARKHRRQQRLAAASQPLPAPIVYQRPEPVVSTILPSMPPAGEKQPVLVTTATTEPETEQKALSTPVRRAWWRGLTEDEFRTAARKRGVKLDYTDVGMLYLAMKYRTMGEEELEA